MARGKQYGKTWWGNAWVDALHRIDYDTNRLPRGKSYANSSRVRDIRIDDQGRVEAKVQGRRSRPYLVEITVKHFSPEQQEAIKAIIAQDLALASELYLGSLPESILDRLENNRILLLPESWESIGGSCSCPDWANPCKHLAAVYYIIAGEIDKDPFMLFKLRGLKTGDLLQAAGFASLGENNNEGRLHDPLASQPLFIPSDEMRVDENQDAPPEGMDFPLDLSGLAESRENEAVFTLLGEFPLFYPGGDFKALLLKAYKNVARAVEKQELVENEFSFKDTEFTLFYPPHQEPHAFTFFVRPPQKASLLEMAEETREKNQSFPCRDGEKMVLKRKKGAILPGGVVLDRFLALPLKLPAEKSSPGADFLSASAALVQALAQSSSFVPEIRMVDAASGKEGASFYIAYRPLDRSGKLQEAVEYLAALMPPGFIYQAKEKAVLPGTEGAWEFLSIFLSHLVHRFSEINAADKICRTFFRGEKYRPERFEEQQTAKVISDWFGWLNLRPVPISPVLNISLPPPEQEAFRLSVHVEDKENPLATTLPLAEVFSEREMVFSRTAQEVRQEIARQLTIAGAYIPVLKKLLNHKGSMQAKLDPSAVGKVLTEGKQICSLLGIRVTVPRELKQMAWPRLSMAAWAHESLGERVSYLNLEEMLQFSWQVSLGDQNISREEFMELACSAEGVVKFRDQYLLLDAQEVKKILDRLEDPLPQLSSAEALRASITGEVDGIPFQPDQVLQQLLEDLAREEEVELPAVLEAELRPYQLRGFSWLYANTVKRLGSCLADDMGLGKTVQVLALLLKFKEEGRLENPVLVVCPTTLLGNWVKECEKFTPSLQVDIYHGTGRRLVTGGLDLLITSYGVLRRDLEKFKRKKWELVIIDEAQNIKNPGTNQTRAVKALRANSCIAMSGTPVENRLMELWSIFDFVNRGYLGARQDFIKNVAVPIEKYRDQEQIHKLKKATAPFLLRRLKNDKNVIKDLPQKAIKNQYCYLSREQAALYQQVTESMMEEIEEQGEGVKRKGLIFKLMTALKQICNHPVQYTKKGSVMKEHSGKAEKTLFLLEKIMAAGEKALLFTQYREMGELLVDLVREELKEEALFFHGGLSRKKREGLVEAFQTDGYGSPLMIVSLKAGGSGLNLTAATNVIHYDLWWNPAVEDQATDRTYRIGQSKDVQVHRLISLGTFEEKIDEMISAKKELADLTVSAGESRLSELSDAELKSLFALEQ